MNKPQDPKAAEPAQTTSATTVDLPRLVRLLVLLDAAIPEGEGAVSLNLFSDLSGYFTLEMWGVVVAKGAFGGKIITDRVAVTEANPDWLPDVESIVARLNSILTHD